MKAVLLIALLVLTCQADPLDGQLPPECQTAATLTQSWRMDHDGNDLQGGGPHSHEDKYACDMHENLQWFRFGGAAGNRMLDSCPLYKSCGTWYPFWTDDAMPQTIGVATAANAYGVMEGNCKTFPVPMEVMRCSWSTPHDLIYKYTGVYFWDTCFHAFCGAS